MLKLPATKRVATWLAVIATLLGIVVSLHQLFPTKIVPARNTSKVTRAVSVRSRIDTIRVHDTLYATIYLQAKANRHGSDTAMPSETARIPSSGADSLSSQSVCLDSLLWSPDTNALGPDTISVCLDKRSDMFSVALGLAPREHIIAAPFRCQDSTITLKDSLTVENTGQSFWDVLEKDLEIAGSFLFGVLLGRVL